MTTKRTLLDTYDGPTQDTKRAIVAYLHDNPDREHDPETIFEAIRDECRANTPETVANQLSALATEHDVVALHERSFYQWAGPGRRRPNRRLRDAVSSTRRWVDSLELSYGTGIVAFLIWLCGIGCALVSLIPLFTSVRPLGVVFIEWFVAAGIATILGSAVLVVWVPVYLLDVHTAT
jgi:hypothetical protein